MQGLGDTHLNSGNNHAPMQPYVNQPQFNQGFYYPPAPYDPNYQLLPPPPDSLVNYPPFPTQPVVSTTTQSQSVASAMPAVVNQSSKTPTYVSAVQQGLKPANKQGVIPKSKHVPDSPTIVVNACLAFIKSEYAHCYIVRK